MSKKVTELQRSGQLEQGIDPPLCQCRTVSQHCRTRKAVILPTLDWLPWRASKLITGLEHNIQGEAERTGFVHPYRREGKGETSFLYITS